MSSMFAGADKISTLINDNQSVDVDKEKMEQTLVQIITLRDSALDMINTLRPRQMDAISQTTLSNPF